VRRSVYCTASLLVSSRRPTKFPVIYPDLRLDYKVATLPPKPKAEMGEVVVKIETCGLCHSDIHAAHGDWPFKPNLPLIPGHEAVGIVESLGTGVKEVKEGDRVAIPWMGYACGSCGYCVSGWENLCEQQVMTGYLVDGGYAEYAKANAKFVGKVPHGVDLT
jgi:alcohol dehydrogenase, propanol-preferring